MPLVTTPPDSNGVIGLDEFPFPPGFSRSSGGGPILPADEKALVEAWKSVRGAIAKGPITVPISGGDDWPTAAALAIKAAQLGVPLRFGPGTYKAQSRQVFPSNLVILGTPQTTIAATITPTNNLDSVFCTGIGASIAATTLSAQPNLGAKQIQITAATIPANTEISVAITDSVNAFRTSMYRVVAGQGTTTLTLDRPLRWAAPLNTSKTSFPNGSVVEFMRPTENLFIYGNGMKIVGLCNRYIEFIRARNCYAFDITLGADATGANALERLWSIDSPSYHCAMMNVKGDCAGTVPTTIGLSFESSEDSFAYRCTSRGATATNLTFQDSMGCGAIDCLCVDAASGQNALFTAASNVIGCDGCWIERGDYGGSADSGIAFENGSSRCLVDGAAVYGCTNSGILVKSGAFTCIDNEIRNCLSRFNGAYGVEIPGASSLRTRVVGGSYTFNTNGIIAAAGSIGTKVIAADFSNTATLPFSIAADLDLIDVECVNPTTTNQIASGTGNCALRIRGGRYEMTNAAGASMIFNGASVQVDIDATDIVQVAGGIGPELLGGAVCRIGRGANVTGHGAGGIGLYSVVGTMRVAEGARSQTTAFTSGGATGYFNFGTFANNGATPVVVAFPDLKITDEIVPVLKTVGGAQGPTPITVMTPGTGFTSTATAGDTSTNTWKAA